MTRVRLWYRLLLTCCFSLTNALRYHLYFGCCFCLLTFGRLLSYQLHNHRIFWWVFFYFSTFVYLFYINFLVIMKLLLCSLSFESLVRFKCFFFAFIHFQLVGNRNKCIIDNFFVLVAFVCKLSIVLFLIMIYNFV